MSEQTFSFEKIGNYDATSDWQFMTGFFTGQSNSDVFGYRKDNGTLWIGMITENGLSLEQWGAVEPFNGWQFVCADFSGHRKSDILGYHPSNGTLWIGENKDNRFDMRPYGQVQPAADWSFTPIIIEQSPKEGHIPADIFGFHAISGSLWIGKNTGKGFDFEEIGKVDPTYQWTFYITNFTGKGLVDLIAYNHTLGTVSVAENFYSGLSLKEVLQLPANVNWQLFFGNFTSKSHTDLICYNPNDAVFVISKYVEGMYSTQTYGNQEQGAGWHFSPGIFHLDRFTDLIGIHNNGMIGILRRDPRPIEGYCWPLSARPGEHIGFYISSFGNTTITFNRHRSFDTTVESIPMGTISFEGTLKTILHADTTRYGYGWTNPYEFEIPTDWPSGVYTASCSNRETTCSITFMVKPNPLISGGIHIPLIPDAGAGVPGRDYTIKMKNVAVLANVNTWLAYAVKYSELALAHGSFERPIETFSPFSELTHLLRGELWILSWLEQELGEPPHVFTDIDMHNGFELQDYKLLIIGTHPEYWTPRMYDQLEHHLKEGGSVAYLGGNGLYEVGTYYPDGKGMSFRNGREGSSRSLALMRVVHKHERNLLGISTERCNVIGSKYKSAMSHPLFNGTGIVHGNPEQDFFGDNGYNLWPNSGGPGGNGKASGLEVDTVNGYGSLTIGDRTCYYVGDPYPTVTPATSPPSPDGVCSFINSMDGTTGRTRPSMLPAGLQIIARGESDAVGVGADMTYYRHPGGGFVFSVGSITFGGSLIHPDEPKLQALMRNVLKEANI